MNQVLARAVRERGHCHPSIISCLADFGQPHPNVFFANDFRVLDGSNPPMRARIAPTCTGVHAPSDGTGFDCGWAMQAAPRMSKATPGLRTHPGARRVGAGLKPAPTCVGHRDVEVTEAAGEERPVVSQAFCSALPVAYTRVPASHWQAFASLVLQAAYEATMSAAVLNAQRGTSNVVLLTQLGGGAFGNHNDWIHAAMRRALEMVSGFELDVRLVSYGTPSQAILQMAEHFN